MKIFILILAISFISTTVFAQKALVITPFKEDKSLVTSVKSAVEKAGYSVDTNTVDVMSSGVSVDYDLTVICDARYLPADSLVNFWHYLNNKKDVIALNAPAWEFPLANFNGSFVEREKFLKENAFDKTFIENPITEITLGDKSLFKRDSGVTENTSDLSFEKEILTFETKYAGWEYLRIENLQNPFPNNNSVTVFAVKGDNKTSRVIVRWIEKDKSEWNAVVHMDGKDWKLVMLPLDDFTYNGGNEARKDSKFNPQNASSFAFGFDWSSTDRAYLEQSVSISNFGTAEKNENLTDLYGSSFSKPDYFALAPDYAFFEMNEVTSLVNISDNQKLPMPEHMKSAIQRPQAHGYDKARHYRWIPFVKAETNDKKWRGNPIAMRINFDTDQPRSSFAGFAINDTNWYCSNSGMDMITKIASKMKKGVYFMDAGADCYTYMPESPIKIGANIINIRKENLNLNLEITVKDKANNKEIYSKKMPVSINAGEKFNFDEELKINNFSKSGYNVSTRLLENNKVIDGLAHDFYMWEPKAEPNFVKIENGKFIKDGKLWKINGVNYHPTSTNTTQDWNLFLEWFGKKSYDPEVIDRDLENIVNLNINALSIQVFSPFPHAEPQYDNLIDFLRRMDKYGLKANLALVANPTSDSVDDRFAVWEEVIKKLRLPENDVIFAYDIDWEPTWMTPEYRNPWNKDWENWIIERYGSVENAEKDWNCKITRDGDGNIINPPVHIIQADSENRNEALAYRRFLEFLGYKKYSHAIDLYKSIDQNHYVSFRKHAAGDVCHWYGLLPYSFNYLGKAIDIFEPEAYATGNSWDDHFKTGLFTRAIAKWANPNAPLFYSEVGYNIIEGSYHFPTQQGFDKQDQFYTDFYRMLIESGCDGVFWWWYPGGYRYLENSDMGIINPDDSERSVTKIVRELGAKFMDSPSFEPDTFITVDPSKVVSSTNATGLYEQVEDEYWNLVNSGKKVGLKTPATGLTSENCDLISITNTPYNGSNPPKYLDGSFDKVTVSDGINQMPVIDGSTINLTKGKNISLSLLLKNLNEAIWAGGNDILGYVVIKVNERKFTLPKNVGFNERINISNLGLGELKEDTTITISLEAVGRAVFGEKINFTIKAN